VSTLQQQKKSDSSNEHQKKSLAEKEPKKQVATDNPKAKSSAADPNTEEPSEVEILKEEKKDEVSDTKDQERVLITGDDILIEYVERLITEISAIEENEELKQSWRISIEKFITHYVWHSQDAQQDKIKHGQRQSTPFSVRLNGRLTEMQERRRRLIKYLYKKEGKLNEFEQGFKESIAKKSAIIKKFSSV
jgi:hypothetical protein